MKNQNSSVAAVIVTFNRADKLKNVIDALLSQTINLDAIYVVDNASTDNTQELLKTYSGSAVTPVLLPQNVGGAGGFHAGLRLAYEKGHDHIWVSDDDAYPEPDALEVLLKTMHRFDAETQWRTPYACSKVNWIDGTICAMNIPSPVWDWPRWYDKSQPFFLVGSCSFVSVMVARWAIEKHGLPIKDYFIWHDDVEYTMRLSRSYPGLYVPDSIVVHDTPENKGVNFGLITEGNLWKYKFGARNEASRQLRDRGVYGYLAYLYNIRAQMGHGKVARPLRFQIYRSALNALRFRPKIDRV